MFARTIVIRLKPNALAQFNETFDDKILPILEKQKGFLDAITLIGASGLEVLKISFWDSKLDAEMYRLTAYKDVQKHLAKIIEGTPRVQNCAVGTSTFHQLAVRGS